MVVSGGVTSAVVKVQLLFELRVLFLTSLTPDLPPTISTS